MNRCKNRNSFAGLLQNNQRIKSMVEIKNISADAAAELSALAKTIYKEHYLHLWNEGGAEWYMAEHAYPTAKLEAELADESNEHYLVTIDGLPAGYLKLRSKYADDDTGMELERIYLRRSATGKGIGRKLMELADNMAAREGKKWIYLKAMDSSLDAIGFYRTMGYEQCGTYTLPFSLMKKEYRGMVVLRKEIQ
jgi:GNAT superfamily N-acetyltransferase